MQTTRQSETKESGRKHRISHNRPCLDSEDARAAYDVVMSGWLAGGPICRSLEVALAGRILGKTGQAAVCANGTSALFLALHSLEIGVGDEVIIPSYVCTAVLNAVTMVGATPVLADIDAGSLSLTKSTIEPHITDRTRAVVVVHTYGIPCECEPLGVFGLPLIEDCAQALGATFSGGSPVGSKGDLAVFSFYATKFLTGGNGGAVIGGDSEQMAAIRNYLDFDAPLEYRPRFNFQLSDINAAVCLSQFQKLDSFLQRRLELGRLFCSAVSGAELVRYSTASDGRNLFRFLLSFASPETLRTGQRHFADRGIDTIVPLEPRELLHRYLGQDVRQFPNSERASKTLLSLPIYPGLSDDDAERIVAALTELTIQ